MSLAAVSVSVRGGRELNPAPAASAHAVLGSQLLSHYTIIPSALKTTELGTRNNKLSPVALPRNIVSNLHFYSKGDKHFLLLTCHVVKLSFVAMLENCRSAHQLCGSGSVFRSFVDPDVDPYS